MAVAQLSAHDLLQGREPEPLIDGWHHHCHRRMITVTLLEQPDMEDNKEACSLGQL
jgi:hypothetical protein